MTKMSTKFFKNKVINHFLTHFVSNCSEPIFKAFKNKLLFIRMFRSPLNVSMIKHLAKWSIKWENMKSRDGILKAYDNRYKKNYPFFVKSNLKDYLAANIYERAVIILELTILKKINLERLGKKYGSRVITIPFENLIVNPNYYMKQISNILGIKKDSITSKIIKKNYVPRKFDLFNHDSEGFKYLKSKIGKKYLIKLNDLNNFYHKKIIRKY